MKGKIQFSRILFFCMLALFLVDGIDAVAQKKKKGKAAAAKASPAPKKNKGPKKVSDEIKKLKEIDGLFTLYRDSTTGSVKMVIKEDQLNKEFIHWYYIENGPTEAGAFRGQFRASTIFKVQKYYDKIEFVSINTSGYFDPENSLFRQNYRRKRQRRKVLDRCRQDILKRNPE